MKQSHFNVSSQNFVSVTHNSRRSANYKPNIWKHHFLQSLHTKYHVRSFSSSQILNLHIPFIYRLVFLFQVNIYNIEFSVYPISLVLSIKIKRNLDIYSFFLLSIRLLKIKL